MNEKLRSMIVELEAQYNENKEQIEALIEEQDTIRTEANEKIEELNNNIRLINEEQLRLQGRYAAFESLIEEEEK